MLFRASKSVKVCLRSLHTEEANPALQCSLKPLGHAKATLIARTDGQEEMAMNHEFAGYPYLIGCSECKHVMTLRYKDLNGQPGYVFKDLKQRDPKFAHLLEIAYNSAQRLHMNDLSFGLDRHTRMKGYVDADWRIGCPGAAFAASQEK
jgi:hypothetical protein